MVTLDLLCGVLVRDSDKRFGEIDIEQHDFYQSMDWKRLYDKDVKVLYKPYKEDLSYLDDEFTGDQ